jgi:23S rRNA (cytidine1920-2'-O)/16S rRNA (cytidine1409-2'-O)-methyltransferase
MRKRADFLLVELGLFASRARAQAAIAAGLVNADGQIVRRASQMLAKDARIEATEPHPWVSRGGVKLAAALIAFDLDPKGLACLDVGASTGGFTDVLLARGAASVVAIDVGHGQLARRLAADRRVTSHEGLDARRLTADIVGAPAAIVIDLSFISQTLALPVVLPLAARPAWLVSLIKPQFEVGRDKLVKGAVKDPAELKAACAAVRACVEALGWASVGLVPSPIAGGDGAREFLYAARHE